MPRVVQLGSRTVSFPGPELDELDESSSLLSRPEALSARFEADGYLFLRGVLPEAMVTGARQQVLDWIATGASVAELRRRARLEGPVRRLIEHRALFDALESLLGEPVTTFSFKWLRSIDPGVGTGAHCDAVYMGRGSPRVRTCWIPFGPTPVEQGTLAVCEGSHRASGFDAIRRTYGELDVDRDHIHDTGWFTDEPLELGAGQWRTADFEAGDVIVFGLHTMHAATTNLEGESRVSCDVRFQPSSEPADERWVGADPIGHTTFGRKTQASTTVAALRRQWGL